MNEWYRKDLAYIHDIGFRSYVLQAIPVILAILKQHGIQDGLIVDLGCGSGLSAEELVRAGYRVLGVDISAAMIEIARCRVPLAEFQVKSFFKVEIPNCSAVISIGECFNGSSPLTKGYNLGSGQAGDESSSPLTGYKLKRHLTNPKLFVGGESVE